MHQKRSLLQKSQSKANLLKIKCSHKKNISPNLPHTQKQTSSMPSSSAQTLQSLQESYYHAQRAEDYKRRLHNEHRQLQHAKHRQEELYTKVVKAENDLAPTQQSLTQALDQITTLQREKKALRMRLHRTHNKHDHSTIAIAMTHQIKEKGVIADSNCAMV